MLTVESFRQKFLEIALIEFFKLATHQAHYLNYKYSTQFKKKTSRFQENRPWVKTAMTSLRCYGNPDLNKIHRTRNFELSLARVWISISCISLVRCDLYFKLEGVTIKKSIRATLKRRLRLHEESFSPGKRAEKPHVIRMEFQHGLKSEVTWDKK